MSGQLAIHEAQALKYKREDKKSQVQLVEYMGAYEEDDEEEGQARKRPKTMGLRKALAKQKEEESAQAQQFPLIELLAMEIEHNRESWIERANIHLEAKLEKANKDLSLQWRMTEHYKQRNHFARKKLKTAQSEGTTPNDEKDQDRLGILAQNSL